MDPDKSIISSGTIIGSALEPKTSLRNAQDQDRVIVRSKTGSLTRQSREMNDTNPPDIYTSPPHDQVPELSLPFRYLQQRDTTSRRSRFIPSLEPCVMHHKVTWYMTYDFCIRKRPSNLKFRTIFWHDWNVLRRHSQEIRFRTNQISKPSTPCVSTIKNLLQQQSSLPHFPTHSLGFSTSTTTANQQKQPGYSSDYLASQLLRTRACEETIDISFSTGVTSNKLTPLERRVLFTDDISNLFHENIEITRQQLRRLRPRNAEPATVAVDQVRETTMDQSSPTEPVANLTGCLPTTTNNHRSTFDEEGD